MESKGASIPGMLVLTQNLSKVSIMYEINVLVNYFWRISQSTTFVC